MTEQDFPPLYRAADLASTNAQGLFFKALFWNLTLLVVAAISSVANIATSWFALLQMIPLMLTLGLTIFLATKQPQRTWYGMRALAESIKTVSWRYMMRAEPFNVDDATALIHFRQSLSAIFDANKSISSQATAISSGPQITEKMQIIRSLSLEDRINFYEKERVDEQQDWYSRKATTNEKSAKWWFRALIALNLFAIFFAAGKIANPTVNFWPTDILVAAAASVMGWVQTKRFQELAASYTLTAHEIGLLRIALPAPPTEDKFSLYVGDAENAFSREHTQWQARRDTD